MNIDITPSSATKALITKFGNYSEIVRQAKIKTLTMASMMFSTKSKEVSPIKTGNLRRNIKYTVNSDGSQARVYNNLDYALYQEEGTGIYGPKKKMIVPVRKKFLVFEVGGKIVFARKVRGVRPKWFMRQGSQEVVRRNGEIDKIMHNSLLKELS